MSSTKAKIGAALVVAFNVALSVTPGVPSLVVWISWIVTAFLALWWISEHYFGLSSERTFDVTITGMMMTKQAIYANQPASDLVAISVTLLNRNTIKKASLRFVLSSPHTPKRIAPVSARDLHLFGLQPFQGVNVLHEPVALDEETEREGALIFVDASLFGNGAMPTKRLEVKDTISDKSLVVDLGGNPAEP